MPKTPGRWPNSPKSCAPDPPAFLLGATRMSREVLKWNSPPKTNGWNLKLPPWKWKIIYKAPILGFDVSFWGCNWDIYISLGIQSYSQMMSKRCQITSKPHVIFRSQYHSQKVIGCLEIYTVENWRMSPKNGLFHYPNAQCKVYLPTCGLNLW